MKHLYINDEGETVAANSSEEAANYYDIELGGLDHVQSYWHQVPDDNKIFIQNDTGQEEVKTALEWASEYDEVTLIATTYA